MSALYVVTTPIGNLADLSARAAETLREVGRVLAEDTRRTRGLLTHLGIASKPLSRLDAHAPESTLAEAVERLLAGESAALVTDAGVPGVSDPGARLIQAAVEAGVRVIPIPGPSAVTAAVSISGFVEGPFLFLGFLPRQGKPRQRAIERLADAPEPVVIFESPERIEKTLRELAARLPDRGAVLCRELTKLHEETLRGSLGELAKLEREWRGEITLVVDRAPEEDDAARAVEWSEIDAEIRVRLSVGEHTKDIAEALGERLGRPRRELYERVESVKRRG